MISVKVEGLADLLKTLEALPPEIVSKRGGPVRVGLRKAAVVVQKAAQENVRQLAQEGQTDESTGVLEKALIVSRKKPGNFKGERFWLRVKRGAKYPDGTTANTTGGVLEFGDGRVRAFGWMRRAWEANKEVALQTFLTETPKAIDAAVKKARKGR